MSRLLVLNVLMIGLLCNADLQAQDFEKVAPKQPKPETRKIELPKSAEPTVELMKEDAVLAEELKGLVFVDSQDKVSKDALDKTGIHIPGIALEETASLVEKLRGFLGKPVSFNLLHDIAGEVILYYRDQDRPVVDVIVPEQDITLGVVQFVVVEGRLESVEAKGNRWFDSELLTEQVRVRRGDSVSAEKILKDLEWLNSNPFREVDVAFTPGKNLGQTDVILHTRDRFPVRFFGGYEDTGNDLTGDERWIAGMNWGNAFFADHQLSYQFTTSSDIASLKAHSAVYLIPLPWRHKLNIFGSRTETEADAAGVFNLRGRSWQVGTRYVIPLPSIETWDHELEFGFDFKQSNNNLEFGGTNVFASTTDVNQWVMGYNASLPDRFGATSLRAAMYYSPGGWSDNNKDSAFAVANAFADAEYFYAKIELNRTTRLPWDFTFFNKFIFQESDDSLLGSEQLGFGGFDSVRGYDEREVNGDTGFLMTLEVRTPPVSIAELFDAEKDVQDQLQFLFFWDYGQAQFDQVAAGVNDNIELSGVGPGVRYEINPYLSVRADYGFQLIDAGNTRYASRCHLGVLLSY
ncbi:MAG: ShlB/FhaC/HecB family hemolysin secretion/activation protein [Verrucomicrobiota bacterium]